MLKSSYMKIHFSLALFTLLTIFGNLPALAQTGFSIEGGLISDRPKNTEHDRPYANMSAGIGYVAFLSFDFIPRAGLEIGVMHTNHDFELAVISNQVIEDNAEKTAFIIRARGIPFKKGKFESVLAAGPAFFDISGLRYTPAIIIEENFSGWGLSTNLSMRYHINQGLAACLYLGLNFVNYNKYTEFGNKAPFPGRLPGGDSFNIGVTLFHRIGNLQL